MALTRKYLASMGLEQDKIDAIIGEHTDTTDALKAERDKYKAMTDEIDGLKSQIKELEKSKADAEKHKADAEKYKADYEAEKTAHDKLKSDNATQAETAKKTAALKKLLKDRAYHDKGIEKIVKYGGVLEDLEIDENGTIKDAEKFMADKIDGEWDEYKGKTEKFEHIPGNQPNNGGGSNQPSRAAQIAAQLHENLYGKSE